MREQQANQVKLAKQINPADQKKQIKPDQQQITHKDKHLGYEALVLGIALVGGAMYIALKTAMDDIGPWMFMAVLFVLGTPVPLVFSLWFEPGHMRENWRKLLYYSAVPAVAAAAGSILLQVALVTSAAGRAGLITSLYVCLLPFVSCFVGYRLKIVEIAGAFVAAIGLYFLTLQAGSFRMNLGDILLVLSALCWTVEIIAIDIALRHVKPFSVSLFQIAIGAIVLAPLVLLVEPASVDAMLNDFNRVFLAILPELLFCGAVGGVTFVLSVYCQKHLSPNRIGLLFSTESLFAVLLGWLILNETFNQRELLGVILIVASLFIVRIKLSAGKDKNQDKNKDVKLDEQLQS